jgi:hypothetical protein
MFLLEMENMIRAKYEMTEFIYILIMIHLLSQ